MTIPYKFRKIPDHFGDRFPDGNYTVGRGADPRAATDATDSRAQLRPQTEPQVQSSTSPQLVRDRKADAAE